MSVAINEDVLKRRIDDYLWRDRSTVVAVLRLLLKEHFLSFDRVAVIGGMVRDFARAGQRGFKSDVDLVVDAPAKSVEELAGRLNAKPNRFGGYSYVTDRWKIDFWALRATWAYTEGHASINRLEDVTNCTFFDWDAVLYDLKRRQVVCSPTYLDLLRNKAIEINLLPTPSINGNLLRAVRRILLWDLEPGPALGSFIMQHLTASSFAEIARTDRAIYTHPFISKFLYAERLQDYIFDRERRTQIATWYGKQLALPGLPENENSMEGSVRRRLVSEDLLVS